MRLASCIQKQRSLCICLIPPTAKRCFGYNRRRFSFFDRVLVFSSGLNHFTLKGRSPRNQKIKYMDYTQSPLWFRVRKVLRYVRLFGISHTLAKVRGQYHMHAYYDALPARKQRTSDACHVGIIGCGNFAFSNIAYYLNKEVGPVLRGVMDIDIHRAASLFGHYRAAYYTADAEEVLSDPAIDLVFIASNHASHADYAIAAIEAGKAVHIEKPHVVNEGQLRRLLAVGDAVGNARIRLGFNRPLSPLSRHLMVAMDTQDGASMINWFVVGHKLDPNHWYLHPAEGGRPKLRRLS